MVFPQIILCTPSVSSRSQLTPNINFGFAFVKCTISQIYLADQRLVGNFAYFSILCFKHLKWVRSMAKRIFERLFICSTLHAHHGSDKQQCIWRVCDSPIARIKTCICIAIHCWSSFQSEIYSVRTCVCLTQAQAYSNVWVAHWKGIHTAATCEYTNMNFIWLAKPLSYFSFYFKRQNKTILNRAIVHIYIWNCPWWNEILLSGFFIIKTICVASAYVDYKLIVISI